MKKIISIFLFITFLFIITSCKKMDKPTQSNPVTITIWHTYVENMRDVFDDMIDDFNHTVGAENGITVKVTSITDAKIVNEHLIAAVNHDPGAAELPDMAVVYPNVAITLAEKDALIDFEQYFSKAELGGFVSQFLDEGRLGGEQLYLIPIAKSAEVLYVNRTLFDRFSSEMDVELESLATFEGIAEAAVKYYEWTDNKTQDIQNDGKMFFYPEGLFNQAMVGFKQLGGDIVRDEELDLSNPIFEKIWNAYYNPAVKGGIPIVDGWGNYLAATGDIVCATASSAGSTFYPARITYSDNTKEEVIFDVLPYPIFEGGKKVVFQRGGGICVLKSEPIKEYASYIFLKWFIEAERNLQFTSKIGYMPVQKSSFDDIIEKKFPMIENKIVEKALLTVANMQKDYSFYFPPVFDGFDSLQNQYVDGLKHTAQDSRDNYLQLIRLQDKKLAFDIVSKDTMTNYIKKFNP